MSAPDSTMPADYAESLDAIAPGITGIVAEQTATDENWWDALLRSLPQITATVQQRQIMLAQIERAKQGLPPISTDQLTGVAMSDSTKNALLFGALGLAAFLMLKPRGR